MPSGSSPSRSGGLDGRRLVLDGGCSSHNPNPRPVDSTVVVGRFHARRRRFVGQLTPVLLAADRVGPVRIVSVNAWCGAVFEPLIEWLTSCDADVICLQEVTSTPGLTGRVCFDDGERRLDQRASLFDDVNSNLPRHQGWFVTNDAGPVTDDDGNRHQQDFGLATFVHQRLPVIGIEASFVLHRFSDQQQWATTNRARMAHGVRVFDREIQRSVVVVHLHGVRDEAGKGDTPERRTQAENLAALVERLRQPGDVTVVAGDLNLLPDSETFELLGEIGLVDLVGSRDTRTSLYSKPIRHANYLLVSDPDLVKQFDIPTTPEISDHRPLVLDI